MNEQPIFVVGDVHGYLDRVVTLLHEAGLLDDTERWAASDAQLWFLGDFFDRGPDGVGVVDLVMRLQREAAERGGHVGALLGNHEALLLVAEHLREDTRSVITGKSFMHEWLLQGGNQRDLDRLTNEHLAWLRALPVMALVDDRLLVHADSVFYTAYGRSIELATAAIQSAAAADDPEVADQLLSDFASRYAFDDAQMGGAENARLLLATYGGRQVIHGHTPIPYIDTRPPHTVTAAMVYANGLAVNVDGGIALGGPGFVHRLRALPSE